jgi:hypothetical protein
MANNLGRILRRALLRVLISANRVTKSFTYRRVRSPFV